MVLSTKRLIQAIAVFSAVLVATAVFARPPVVDEPEPVLEEMDPLPVRKVVVASPRAAIVGLRNDTDCPRMAGAAWNFPRHHIRMVVRRGTIVVFRESRNVEGVWYAGTVGRLCTKLVLQHFVTTEDGERKWVTLGTDGAHGTRRGPSIGTADVKVPHQFRGLGYHLLRAVVVTTAQPLDNTTDPPTAIGQRAAAHDTIYILVRVIPRDSAEVPDEEMPPDPDDEATIPMEKIE